MTGGHTVAGVVNWDYLALKVGIFIDSQKLSSIFHLSLNHFVHPAKKNKKRKLLPKEYFFKIDGATHQQVWRHTYGQPRGFDARCCRQKYHFSKHWHLFERIHCPGTSTMSAMGLPWMLTGTT